MCIRDRYYDAKIFESDPFQKLDTVGVGSLMKMAVAAGKATRPDPVSYTHLDVYKRQLRKSKNLEELSGLKTLQ